LQPEVLFTNTSYNANPELWSFGDSTFSVLENPIHIYDDPGIYDIWLTVSDSNQCIDSVSKKIIMYYDFVLYMPDSFTPNDDGDNDTFGPKGMRMEKYQSFQFLVYDRWGSKVFETENIAEWWDGNKAPIGDYSWIITIKDEIGKIRKEVGLVNLIR
jgi:gliding motility-associated-like protein